MLANCPLTTLAFPTCVFAALLAGQLGPSTPGRAKQSSREGDVAAKARSVEETAKDQSRKSGCVVFTHNNLFLVERKGLWLEGRLPTLTTCEKCKEQSEAGANSEAMTHARAAYETVLGDCRIFGIGGHPAGGLSVNESTSSLRVHR